MGEEGGWEGRQVAVLRAAEVPRLQRRHGGSRTIWSPDNVQLRPESTPALWMRSLCCTKRSEEGNKGGGANCPFADNNITPSMWLCRVARGQYNVKAHLPVFTTTQVTPSVNRVKIMAIIEWL